MKYGVRFLMVMSFLLIAGLYSGAQAQKVFFVFAHGQYAAPLQTSFKDAYNFGLGAEGGAGINVGKKTFLTGTVGYMFFDAKSGKGGNITLIPMKLGLRKYFLPTNLIYVHADAGVASIKDKTINSTYSRFTADVGAGVKLGAVEMGLAFDGFSRKEPSGFASWVAFKAGYRFGL